jgi:hypothetical protein
VDDWIRLVWTPPYPLPVIAGLAVGYFSYIHFKAGIAIGLGLRQPRSFSVLSSNVGRQSVIVGCGWAPLLWIYAMAREPRSGELHVVSLHVALFTRSAH